MVSARSAWAASLAVLPLLFQTALAFDDIFTYPTQEGLTFYEKDTVIVSYETTIANVSLWTFCWEKDDQGKDVLRTKKVIDDAEDNNGSEPIIIDFTTNSDNCWFNFRDNDDKGEGRGANSVVFSLRADPRDKQTVWRLSEADRQEAEDRKKKEEEEAKKKEEQEKQTSAAPSSTSGTTSTSQTATSSTSGPTTGTGQEAEFNTTDEDDKNGGLSTRAKIAIFVSVGLGLVGAAVAGVGYWMMRRRKRARQSPAPLMRETDRDGEAEMMKDPQMVGYYSRPTDEDRYGGGGGGNRGYVGGSGHAMEMNTMSQTPSTVYAPVEAEAGVPTELPTRISHRPGRSAQELPA